GGISVFGRAVMRKYFRRMRSPLASLRARQCHAEAPLALILITMLAWVAGAAEPKQIEEIHLAVRSAAPPIPAMRYHFMPDLVDQVPGNAALLYLAAAQQMASTRGEPENNPPGTDDEKIDHWLNTPAHELPREEVRLLLERYSGALRQFRLAARR